MRRCTLLFSLAAVACAGGISQTRSTEPTQSKFAELDGMKVHYVTRGKGDDALVFVHGWNCDLTFWKHQLDAFPQWRVIAIDLPGHGESDKPRIDYTMSLHARAVDAVLREARVRRAVLVSHSNGTPVARQFYRMFPEKTAGLVIADGALRPFAPREQIEQFVAPLRGPGYEDYVRKLIDAMTQPMKNTEARDEIRAAAMRTPQYVSASEMDAIMDDAIWRTDKINVPTLMILAKQPAWNADYESFVRDLVPNLDYRVWEGVSHFLMIDRPNDFNAAVAEFVRWNILLPG